MKCPNCAHEVRETAKFCPSCGQKIVVSQPTQLVRPRPDAAPPPVPPPAPDPAAQRPFYTPPPGQQQPGQPPPQRPPVAPPVYPPPAYPPAAPQPAPAAKRGLRLPAWPILAGVAAVLLLALGALWFFFLRGGGGATAGAPEGERVLYTVGEGADWGTMGESLTALTRDGDQTELVFDRDGIWVWQGVADPGTHVAPNGRWLAVYSLEEVMLVEADGGAEVFTAEDAQWSGIRNFAPDSSAYAYTSVTADEDENDVIELVVVDAEGQTVGRWPDLAFAGFFSDGDRILAMRLDDEGLISDLVTVALPDGQPERVVTLDDSSGDVSPFIYDDRVYYRHDDELRRADANGENVATVYRLQSDLPFISLVPGLDKLLVLERSESSGYGDLYLVSPDGEERTRIDQDVTLDPGDNGSGGLSYAVAGERLAYTTLDSGGKSLFIINTDGSDRVRLADEQSWLSFVFSPDGRWLAYVAGSSPGLPGELYVVELPDGEPIRLARDAWSVIYSGDRLLYSAVDGAESGDPESTVHRVTYDGDEDEVIFGPEDGFIRFITSVR